MLKPNTVFVLGAAVSNELNFPLGSELKGQIANLLPNTSDYTRAQGDFVRAASNAVGNAEWLRQCLAVRAGVVRAASIDNLIEHRIGNKAFVDVAKLAIAGVIGAKDKSLSLDISPPTYQAIFSLMVGGCGVGQIVEALNRVSFITFNYDRSLEIFLRGALMAYCGFNEAKAAELVGGMKIHHVYGFLGTLPSTYPGPNHDPLLARELADMAAGLKTFSEEHDTAAGEALKDLMDQAQQLIVLGCALHPRNMQLLTPRIANFKSMYATQYVPAPADKSEHSKPPITDFAIPAINAFRTALFQWQNKRSDRISFQDVTVEPLTCVQMVVKYGSSWLA